MDFEPNPGWIGMCPVCERYFHVDRRKRMVHHGFQRPGHGSIEGDCFGVHYPAYEISSEGCEAYRKMLYAGRAGQEHYLSNLEERKLPTLTVERRSSGWSRVPEFVQYERGTPEYERAREDEIYNTQANLRRIAGEIERATGLIDNWRPGELTPAKEIEREAEEKREVRKRELGDRRIAKAQEKAASFHKRIGFAVRRKDAEAIREMWIGAKQKIREADPRLTVEQALALIDRDDVWRAFGLMDEHGRYRLDERRYNPQLRFGDYEMVVDHGEYAALDRMKGKWMPDPNDRFRSIDIPPHWPEELS